MDLVSSHIRAVERSLDGLALRHEAIATNIANVNTPGYTRQEVAFEESLEAAFAAHESGHGEAAHGASVTAGRPDVLLTWQPVATQGPATPQRLDGNGTSVEKEISGMAENALRYNAVSSVVAKQYQLLKTIAQAK